MHRLVPRSVPVPADAPSDDDTPAIDDAVDDEVDTTETAETADLSTQPDDEAPGDGYADEPTGEPPPEDVQGRRPSPVRGVRRAAVPTWDDILFGMKPKDGS